MLGADGKADGRRGDALIEQLFLGQLGMRRGCRMDDQRLHVRDVCQQRENFQVVDEPERGFLPALDFEREDARAAVREVALIERVVGIALGMAAAVAAVSAVYPDIPKRAKRDTKHIWRSMMSKH